MLKEATQLVGNGNVYVLIIETKVSDINNPN